MALWLFGIMAAIAPQHQPMCGRATANFTHHIQLPA